MKEYRLSKSKIISGLQCVKKLYLDIHQPDLAEYSEADERKFNIGFSVGEIAQRLFPDGILIESQDNLSEAIRQTQNALKQSPDKPIFEATFSHGGVLVRADVFMKSSTGYRMIEVKAATSLKDYYLNDTAIQTWVVEGAGYPIERTELAHINNQFVYRGGDDYSGLFVFNDVTEIIEDRIKYVAGWISGFQTMLAGDMPDIDVGNQCHNPFDCPYIHHCQGDLSEYHIGLLPRGGSVLGALMSQGIEDVRDIPDGFLENENHERVRRVTVSGQPEVLPELGKLLKILDYPRYFLDFETIQYAVPIWIGTRPYQQLPFQFSCHIEAAPGNISHKDFLDLSGEAPMRSLTDNLIETLGDRGSIFVYGSFENTRLNDLALMFPDLADKIEHITGRIVDLLPFVRRCYYHPAQKGSWSMKAVLPTIAPELSYKDLIEVQDGTAAQTAYLEAISADTSEARKKELETRMLEYCKLDTLGLVKIVDFFSK